jgi:hypothetical protein
VEDWESRGKKSLIIESANGNASNINVTGTFELYIFYNELSTNPIAENAQELRNQAQEDGNSLCIITFPTWSNNSAWIESVKTSATNVTGGGVCNINICHTSECSATLNNAKNEILGFENCECDVAIEVDDTTGKFALYTVAFYDAEQTRPNNITLVGLFEAYSSWGNEGAPTGSKDFFGIPINDAAYPNMVPRFRTLQDLADRMGQVLTRATSINTTVTTKYTPGNPGSLIFGIDFDIDMRTPPNGLSFSSDLALGDLASVAVERASFDLSGRIRVAAELGIVFGPDEKSQLNLVGEFKNETSPCNITAFNVTIHYEKNNTKGNDTIVLVRRCNISDKLRSLKEAFDNSKLKSNVNVSEIGSSGLFALTFDSDYSYAEVTVAKEDEDNLKKFGLVNGSFEKKAPFQVAIGLIEITAETEVTGNADVTANVADVLEVTADVYAELFGQVQFSAGKRGQLIPFDDWLAALIAVKDSSSEYYVIDFAVASLTLEGGIEGTVSVEALGLSTKAIGKLIPYKLDLLSLGGTIPKPQFVLDVNLPKFGDLRNLSFADVINLLNQALELLVGPEDADTVESCSGGLLGHEVFTFKIPVVGVSACDFAGVLKVITDAVDTLVKECVGCDESSGTNSAKDPTFQVLEVKLKNLLQGNVIFV